ncbi:hypothetical protein KKF92_00440 [Patescibacteria group bacterium]|nr:hypothetical protein [Patescibacteria group bacterium]
MELPNLFQPSVSPGHQRFIFIVISESYVQSFLVGLRSKPPAEMINQSSQYVFTDQKNLILKTDESLRDLGEESDAVTQVVFGLDETWINGEGLLPQKKALIQSIASDLSLEAKGYLVNSQALLDHYFQANKSMSGLVILTTTEEFQFQVLADGQVATQESIGRSQDMPADIAEGLARVIKSISASGQELSPRLILASLSDANLSLEEYRQHLLGLNWEEYPIFFGVPTIELIPPDIFIKIMVQRAAVAILDSGLVSLTVETPVADDFAKIDENAGETNSYFPKSFGIPIDPHRNVEPSQLPSFESSSDRRQLRPTSSGVQLNGSFRSKVAGLLGSMKSRPVDRQLPFQTPKPKQKYHPKPFVVLGLVLGILVWGIVAWWWLMNNTQVIVEIVRQAKPITTEITATLGTKTAQTATGYTLATTPLSLTIDQSISQQTTGIKEIGEVAKGRTIIYNETESQKTLEAGTILTLDNLEFILVNDVTLPEAIVIEVDENGDKIQKKTFGKIEADVEAVAFGEDSNIAKDSKLLVGDFSNDTYSATASIDFTGGSSQEVAVVGQADVDKLLSDVKKDVIREAKQQLPDKIEKGQYYTEPTLSSLTTSEYSAEVGDEAESIKLDVTAQVKTLIYTAQDIDSLAEKVLLAELPDGYELDQKTPEIMSSPIEPDAKDPKVKVDQILIQLNSQALPQLDTQSIKSSLYGKPVTEVVSIVSGRSDVASANVRLEPLFAKYIFKNLPAQPDRIQIILMDTP